MEISYEQYSNNQYKPGTKEQRHLEHQHNFELGSADYGAFLGAIVKYNRCRTVVEIGVAYGTTTPYLCQGVLESDQWNQRNNKVGKVYGFDIWTETGINGLAVQIGDKEVAEEYIKSKGFTNFELNLMDTRSEAFRQKLVSIAPIDFAFIDGDHSYWGTKNDFGKLYDLLAINGIVAFHDTFSCDGAREFIHDLRIKGYDGTFDIVNMPWGNKWHNCGLSLLFKRGIPLSGSLPHDIHGSISSHAKIVEKEVLWYQNEILKAKEQKRVQ